jgi:hypothetical protein
MILIYRQPKAWTIFFGATIDFVRLPARPATLAHRTPASFPCNVILQRKKITRKEGRK